MRVLLAWKPNWKTHAIGEILKYRPGALVDVGAHVGQTLLDFVAAPRGSTYLAFEPNVICCHHLQTFISVNRLDSCRVVPAALGDRNQVAILYQFGSDVDSGSSTMRELRPTWDAQPYTCCMYRLDDISDVLPQSSTSLLKIDVEGTELDVLRGMETTVRNEHPWIICEVLHRDTYADEEPYRQRCSDLMRLLTKLEYSVLLILRNRDDSRVEDLKTIEAFPDVVWAEGSEQLCDYLFVPASEIEAAQHVLCGKRRFRDQPCGTERV